MHLQVFLFKYKKNRIEDISSLQIECSKTESNKLRHKTTKTTNLFERTNFEFKIKRQNSVERFELSKFPTS